MKRLGRIAALGAASMATTAAVVLMTATAASAHVGLSATSTAAGSSTVLTFAPGHGCDGSPTTALAIQIPEGINAATPVFAPGWEIEKVMQDLDTPITDSHGNQVTERVDQIVFTAITPIPGDVRPEVKVSLTLPTDAAGSTLYFPTVQSCAQVEEAWIQIPAQGQDSHDLDSPAPALAVTAAAGEGDGHGEETGEQTEEAVAQDSGDGGQPLSIAALVVGILGVVLGGVALVRGRARA